MKCQSYSFFRGSDYLRIEAISHLRSFQQNQATLIRKHIWIMRLTTRKIWEVVQWDSSESGLIL